MHVPTDSLRLIARGIQLVHDHAPVFSVDNVRRGVKVVRKLIKIGRRRFNWNQPLTGSSFVSVPKPPMTFRRRKRKRTVGVGRGVSLSIAKKAMARVRKLERKSEVKYFDIGVTTIANVGTGGDVRSLAAIAQGDGVSDRDGNMVSPFFLDVMYQWSGVAAAVSELYRTIIFRDRQQIDSTTPTVLTVLTSGSPLAQFVGVNRKRWKILYDVTYSSPEDGAIQLSFVGHARLKLSLKMGHSGGVSNDVNLNGLYMINITNLGASQPSVIFSSRMFYNDG